MATGVRPSPWQAWIRRCRCCGSDDLRAVFGQPTVIDDRPWWCPSCAASDWVAARAVLPVDT